MTRGRRWRAGFAAALSALCSYAPPGVRPAAPALDWSHGDVCYEVFVRSFFDSNGDGVGDINGLIDRLDYINDGNPSSRTDLGASCIWLMPVAASPSYHGYDVTDYYRVEPAYGTNEDFKRLVSAAHRRGIKVLVDMVLNHTSSEHPHFLAALHDTASPYRAWYRFAPAPLGRGPWGEVAWHKSPLRDEYYYGVFSAQMPDLDYHTPAVREEAGRIATFWLRDMGVDGFRLDAIPYLVEDGACQMGCAGTHAFLHEYAAQLRAVKPGAYTVGEAWGNIGAILPYYPDQLTSQFAFELSDSLLAAVRRGTAGGVLRGYLRLQDTLPAYRWSPFLSNHDGTRTMTALGGDLARAKLAATLLLALPGLPFVYYGEEIGMTGDKPDPRLRTPMQWTAGRAGGFTTGAPWETLQSDTATVNVARESADSASLLWRYRALIHLRRRNPALGSGRLLALRTDSAAALAFVRRAGAATVLVVANLGGAPIQRLAVTAGRGDLPPGRYRLRSLLGGPDGAPLDVAPDGSVMAFVAVPGVIAARDALLFELVRR